MFIIYSLNCTAQVKIANSKQDECLSYRDVGIIMNFGNNVYARPTPLLKKKGIDYEILQGKHGYKLFYFVVKNQPRFLCVAIEI
jgi:hypothetical protein